MNLKNILLRSGFDLNLENPAECRETANLRRKNGRHRFLIKILDSPITLDHFLRMGTIVVTRGQ